MNAFFFGIACGGLIGAVLAYMILRSREGLAAAPELSQAESAPRALGSEPRTPPEHEAERLIRTVVDATPLALVFYDESGEILYTNTSARDLFFDGQSPDGKNFLNLVGHAPEPLRQALLGESDELFSVDLEGQRETYHLSRRTFEFAGRLNSLLMVRHLTREVSRREVEVLKRVIRVISHEVNNSLAPVSSLVHSARLIGKNPEHLDKLARVFDTIEERASHLSAFLEGYATLAKLPRPKPSEIDLSPFLDRLGAIFPKATIGATEVPEVWADPVQLEQALINLLKNASEAGGPLEEVQLTVKPAEDGGVEMRVLDRGRGFSSEALANVLVPFYTTKEKGSGLGLTLAREIIEAQGGRVAIRNREGGGACIVCWLPRRALKEGVGGATARARLTLTRS